MTALTPEEINQLVKYFELLIEWDQQDKKNTQQQGSIHEQTSMPMPGNAQADSVSEQSLRGTTNSADARIEIHSDINADQKEKD